MIRSLRPVFFVLQLVLFSGIAFAAVLPENPDKKICDSKFLPPAYELPYGASSTSIKTGHYTYGYEVEYALAELSPGFLNYYMPEPDLVPRKTWIAKTVEEKREWIKANMERLFPEGNKHEGKLVLVKENSLFPKKLVLDETGNVEIISPDILHSWDEFTSALDVIDRELGEGYVQATFGQTSEVVYRDAKMADAYIGLRFALGEMDTLSKLSSGYESHLKTPEYIPGKSFTHPFLGPMAQYKADFMRRVVHQARSGALKEDTIKQISKLDFSYKYTSYTAFRPDVAKTSKLLLNEVRDCVKSFDCLKRRIARERFFFSHNIAPFEVLEGVRHHDPVSNFQLMSENARTMLEEIFAARETTPELVEKIAASTARNFSYPLTDWFTWLELMGMDTEQNHNRIKDAQEAYNNKIARLSDRYHAKEIDKKTAQNEVRIALAEFAHTTKIHVMIEDWIVRKFPLYSHVKGGF